MAGPSGGRRQTEAAVASPHARRVHEVDHDQRRRCRRHGRNRGFRQLSRVGRVDQEHQVLATGADGRAERVRFAIDAGVFKDTYELAYVWSGDRKVEWDLVSGQMQKAQHGSYTLDPSSEGTEVTYSLSVDLSIPMLGMLKRKAERVIMDTALKELKKRVELA